MVRNKKKVVIISAVIIGIIILGSIITYISLYRVRNIGGDNIGGIWKDENENVTATSYLTLYNGTNEDKNVIFDIDGGYEYEKGYLEDEKYEVTEIEITDGNGQVDTENMVLTIPAHGEVGLQITAQNTYTGKDYQGEKIGLRREAPPTSFSVCPD